MNVIGVVGEFNPFHHGHALLLKRARAALGADTPAVAVLSGDFVQRGGPAVFNKQARAAAAVAAGFDLVTELPLPWCTLSAEYFARGAVAVLDSLGVVTHLVFGSECGDIEPLERLAAVCSEAETLRRIRDAMAEGHSFAVARQRVLAERLGPQAQLLSRPNNILAVEYLRALAARGSGMRPMTVFREGAAHDAAASADSMRCASELRALLLEYKDIAPFVPAAAHTVYGRELALGRGPVGESSLESAALSRLRTLSEAEFLALPDAGEGLGTRLYRAVRSQPTLADILRAAGTKRYPTARLRRMLVCGCLGIRRDDIPSAPPYIRVLALSPRGQLLLRRARGRAELPILNRPASVRRLDGGALRVFEQTALARDFYALGYAAPGERAPGSDWRSVPLVMGKDFAIDG